MGGDSPFSCLRFFLKLPGVTSTPSPSTPSGHGQMSLSSDDLRCMLYQPLIVKTSVSPCSSTVGAALNSAARASEGPLLNDPSPPRLLTSPFSVNNLLQDGPHTTEASLSAHANSSESTGSCWNPTRHSVRHVCPTQRGCSRDMLLNTADPQAFSTHSKAAPGPGDFPLFLAP